MHIMSEPAILYFGTPVALISTVNENGSYNLAPMSSVFWLGWRCVLGLDASSKTPQNLARTGECVINLPSAAQAAAVDRIARTTGSCPLPPHKVARGYSHLEDKFGAAGLSPVRSQSVSAPRVNECPVQLEAVVVNSHQMAQDSPRLRGRTLMIELRISCVHLDAAILMDGDPNRVDPDKWRPLIMSFQRFYGLDAPEVHGSRLSEIPETMYRSPDV
jgi:flavin reductase (DIM6/NTAB) family NADH-FMN oxidoreductase RutF